MILVEIALFASGHDSRVARRYGWDMEMRYDGTIGLSMPK